LLHGFGDTGDMWATLGIDLVQDRASREPVPVTATAKVIYRAYQLGAVFFYVGLRGNVLEFTPPLTITESEVAEGIAIIDQALTDVGKGLVSDADVAPFTMW
jgi:4-aminobutyrate aminotransferase